MGRIDLKPRHVGVGTFRATPLMVEYVNHALNSGQISYGPFSQRFEIEFAAIHDCKYAILANSGTSALHVALQACKEFYLWPDGSQVIVPATTFVATGNVVVHNKMEPVFVDIESDTYGIDPTLIQRKITDRTVAIIPAHLFGQACKIRQIMQIAFKHNLVVIEDSCETMFVGNDFQPVGSFGHVGCFSTYVAHLLVTGVGGLCTTNSPGLAARIRSLVNHGIDIEQLNPDNNFRPQPSLGRRFKFSTHGHSFRITEMEAALGVAQLAADGWKSIVSRRQRNARHLTAGFERQNKNWGQELFKTPKVWTDNEHAWMMYPIILMHDALEKEHMMAYLNERQIETRDMLPLVGQPVFGLDSLDYPVSLWVNRSGFYIGCHQHLTTEDIDYVIQVVNQYLTERSQAA